MKLSTTQIALIALFAAIQALLSVFPLTFTIGVSGQITLGAIGGPLAGVLLGPTVGGVAVLLGSLIGILANPAGAIFGVLTVIPPFLGALGSGFVKSRRSILSGASILVSILVFYANPIGREVLIYPWLHIFATIVAFSPLGYKASEWLSSSDPKKPVIAIMVATFLGVLLDHISGSAIAIWYFPLLAGFEIPPQIWYAAVLVYPVERIVLFIIATMIAAPIHSTLRRAKLID